MIVRFKRLHPDAIVPTYGSDGAAALDISVLGDYTILERETLVMLTGVAIEIPDHHVGLMRSRSSLRAAGLHIDGVIDSDYRGELKVIATNNGTAKQLPRRVAQLVIAPVVRVGLVEVEELSSTARGQGGFGSSGR